MKSRETSKSACTFVREKQQGNIHSEEKTNWEKIYIARRKLTGKYISPNVN